VLKGRIVFVAASTIGLGLGLAGPASAVSANDYVTAAAVDATDIASASVSASIQNVNSPDITCGNPTAVGTVVTPATDAHPAGTVDGNDVGNGTGECVTLQGTAFTAKLVTQIEYLPKGGMLFQPIPGCASTATATAIAGVAPVVVPEVTCNYTATSPYAGQPHRVHSILTNTLTTNIYDGFSQPYNGGVGSVSVS